MAVLVWRRSLWGAWLAGVVATVLLARAFPVKYPGRAHRSVGTGCDAIILDGKLVPLRGEPAGLGAIKVRVRAERTSWGWGPRGAIVEEWKLEVTPARANDGARTGSASLPPIDLQSWIAVMQESEDPEDQGWLDPLAEANRASLRVVDTGANIWGHVKATWRAMCWPLLGLAAWVAAQWVLVARQRRARARRGQCVGCGYDLGTPRLEACPECGLACGIQRAL